MKAEAVSGKSIEMAQVFHDWDACSQQYRMGWTVWILHAVDVGAIDSHQGSAGPGQQFASIAGQKRSGTKIILGIVPA